MRKVFVLCILTAGAILAFFGLLAGVLWLRLSTPKSTVATTPPATATQPAAAKTRPVAPQPGDDAPAADPVPMPVVVRVGPIVLKPEDATLHGDRLRLQDRRGFRHIDGFASPDDRAQWNVDVPADGAYSV